MLETNDRIKRLEGMNEAYKVIIHRNIESMEKNERKDIERDYAVIGELIRINDFCEREIKTNERILEKLRRKKNGIDECTRSAEVESVRKGTHALLRF